MTEPAWSLSGDCVEACTSPTVCPYYWGSSAPADLHGGKDCCEGAFTFRIREGRHGNVDLGGLLAGFGFNTGIGGPGSKDPWKAILYLDERASDAQAACLEEIFRTCWSLAGDVVKVKRAGMRFEKEQVGATPEEGSRHDVEYRGFYRLRTEPLRARDGTARYISGMSNGLVYVGRSLENRYRDANLPRGAWDSPGMSTTYFPFHVDPGNLDWVP